MKPKHVKPYKTDSKRLDKKERKEERNLRRERQAGKRVRWESIA